MSNSSEQKKLETSKPSRQVNFWLLIAGPLALVLLAEPFWGPYFGNVLQPLTQHPFFQIPFGLFLMWFVQKIKLKRPLEPTEESSALAQALLDPFFTYKLMGGDVFNTSFGLLRIAFWLIGAGYFVLGVYNVFYMGT